MNIRLYHFFCLLIILLTLNGCGFQLRGYREGQTIPFHTLYLQSDSPYSNFNKALRQTLNSLGIDTRVSPSAPMTLQILSQSFNRTITSLGNAGQTTTYLLSYTVFFRLMDRQQHILLPPHKILVTRNFSITSNQLSGDLNTQNDLQDEMQRDAIQQLITRLSSRALYNQFCQMPAR
ncbi:LPS assembly lipoprotein LptE [Rickettsiella endosymbiont of Dermanyssus gallinae]|uniref:LPS-assembly lipoprotein LptE n=1 Tax=Rickettsiella endosymbiont of Dermanyssus gallinae TaxID=2856608 RepID=UPI001C52DB81|nr:LPS assembly lipoprotein LptE [Rickettsiella endosymbiont of Dermanyssus gallinae]